MSVTPSRPSTLFPALLALLLAVPLAAHSQEPSQPAAPTPPAQPAPEAQMLIWGGGAKREDAEKALTDLKASGAGWEEYYTLAEGFPRILESKTVPGLKPGFFIVALGVCATEESGTLLDAIKAFTPAVYARTVTWADKAPACPKTAGEWKVFAVQRWKKKGLELTAMEVNKEDGAWRVLMQLRDKTGKVLESLEHTSEDHGSVIGCDTNMAAFEAAGPTISLSCEEPDCTTPARRSWEVRYRIDAEGGKIEQKSLEKSYVRGQCD